MFEADLGDGVRAVFTRRGSGSSIGPWQGANLATHVGDDLLHVAANRRQLEAELGYPVVYGRQVHGVQVYRVGEAWRDDPQRTRTDLDPGDGVDALVTTQPELGLGVLVADCVPVLLADARAGVIAGAHAGRVGLLAGVLATVVTAMVAAGAEAGRIRAALGPAAGACCYEVPEHLQRSSVAVIPELSARTITGTTSLDLRAGATAVLHRMGVMSVTVGECTIEDDDSYSYRRQPVTGRFAGVIARS